MERWSGRVALVTGASSGIGAGIATALVKNGMIVIGVARDVDRIKVSQLKQIRGLAYLTFPYLMGMQVKAPLCMFSVEII